MFQLFKQIYNTILDLSFKYKLIYETKRHLLSKY